MRQSTFCTLALLVVSALFSISLVSCGSDDDEGGSLSGKWIDKEYQSDIQDHYREWNNGKRGIVPDGFYWVYDFSGSSVKLYKYIYTFDGTFQNNPDKNNHYQRSGTATYGSASLTWYYYLENTYAYVLEDNALFMSNGRTGSYENGRLYIGGMEYKKFK